MYLSKRCIYRKYNETRMKHSRTKVLIGMLAFVFCLSISAEEKNEYESTEELTSLVMSAHSGSAIRAEEDWQKMIERIHSLIKQGANPDLYIERARGTALGMTIFPSIQERLFFALAPYSKDLNIPHYKNQPLMQRAVLDRSINIISYLGEHGADLTGDSCCFVNGNRPFIYSAITGNDFELTKLLLDKGADINVEHKNSNPLLRSINAEHYAIAKMLIARGANGGNYAILHNAIQRKAPVDFLELLIDLGYGPWSVGRYGETALELAKQIKYTEAINLLESYVIRN